MKRLSLCFFLLCLPAFAQNHQQQGNLNVVDSAACANTATTAGSTVTLNLAAEDAAAVIQISGTFSATVQFQGSADSTNFVAVNGVPVGGTTAVTSTTSTGAWRVTASGMQQVRACISAYTSGTASTQITSSAGSAGSASGGGGGGGGTVTSVSGTAPVTVTNPTTTPNVACATCAIGPGSSTANHVAEFSGTDGITLKDGGAAASGTVTSATIAGTANQVTASGTCTITTTGTCTLSQPNAVILGTDNSAAGTEQLANGSAAAHTILGSAATTSNTVNFFATAPTTNDLVSCVVASTTCTLTDSGVLGTNVVTAAGTLTSGQILKGGGSKTASADANFDDGVTTANTLTYTASGGITASGGPVKAGGTAGVSGAFICPQGTANGHATANTITLECPAAVTAYELVLPGTSATGVVHRTNAAGVDTESISSVANSDLTNASTTVNGVTCTLGSSCTVGASSFQLGFAISASSLANTTNTVSLYSFYVPTTTAFTRIWANIATADASDLYDFGIYSGCSAGGTATLVADAGAQAITTTGIKDVAVAQGGTITITPGWYCFAWTGNAAVLNFQKDGGIFFYKRFAFGASGGASTAGQLPSTLTSPNDAFVFTQGGMDVGVR